MRRTLLALVCCALADPRLVGAQAQQGPETTKAVRTERLGEDHVTLIENVEITFGDSTLFADRAEFYPNEHHIIATGNVVLTQGKNRIAADKADFNTETRLGKFYNATGLATIPPPKPTPPPPGGFAPPAQTQPADVYFYGDEIDKVGLRKYRITNGGFTTCVQPTPRWDLTSATIVLNLDHYTFLRDSVFRVKGVPFLYLPFMYYPTNKDNRATGFLLPTLGTSLLLGTSIHDAFFWAINRSQDATFYNDLFTTSGQGYGTQYRYNYGAGSNGNLRAYMLDQKATTYTQPDGSTVAEPASQSYEIKGNATQQLPFHMIARGNVDYFSSLQEMQTFNVNMVNAAPSQRVYGGNVTGTWGAYNMNATFDHNEFFYSPTASNIQGDTPRIALTRSERPMWNGSPLYLTLSGEFANLVAEAVDTSNPQSDQNRNVTRLDFDPKIRYPFTKWQWFTVNSTAEWRDTYYTRSLAPTADPTQPSNVVLDEGLNRRFFAFQSQMVGPVFEKIFDTPNSKFAEKFKHTIEPFFNLGRTTNIDNYSQIIQTDATDAIIPSTQATYGVTSRLFAKKRRPDGQPGVAAEILDVGITQSYYTNPIASQFDTQYDTSFSGAPPSNFSPIALTVRAIPTASLNTDLRAEFDSHYHSLRTISLNVGYNLTGYLQETVGWSKKSFIAGLPGFNDPAFLDDYLNTSTTLHTKDSRVGGVYTFNYDILNAYMTQQQVSIYYNAQCCGIAFQYQSFNFAGLGSYAPIPADQRFFLSFTLAGLGSFSPFNGAMGGMGMPGGVP